MVPGAPELRTHKNKMGLGCDGGLVVSAMMLVPSKEPYEESSWGV